MTINPITAISTALVLAGALAVLWAQFRKSTAAATIELQTQHIAAQDLRIVDLERKVAQLQGERDVLSGEFGRAIGEQIVASMNLSVLPLLDGIVRRLEHLEGR